MKKKSIKSSMSYSKFGFQVDREREGEQVDRALLKSVLGIFVEIGMGSMDCYVEDFQMYLLAETEVYYKKKAALWIEEASFTQFMVKVRNFTGAFVVFSF